jgi:hypothetical protein
MAGTIEESFELHLVLPKFERVFGHANSREDLVVTVDSTVRERPHV